MAVLQYGLGWSGDWTSWLEVLTMKKPPSLFWLALNSGLLNWPECFKCEPEFWRMGCNGRNGSGGVALVAAAGERDKKVSASRTPATHHCTIHNILIFPRRPQQSKLRRKFIGARRGYYRAEVESSCNLRYQHFTSALRGGRVNLLQKPSDNLVQSSAMYIEFTEGPFLSQLAAVAGLEQHN